MENFKHKILGVVFIHLLYILIILAGCKEKSPERDLYSIGASPNVKKQNSENIAVAPPPFSEDIFPCSDCHADQETNRKKRVLEDMHEEISASFNHDKKNLWCLDCHNAANRDFLHLASGKLVSFEESYKLCGQCHGAKLRDWKAGVHGKRTGEWNGKKQYLLCVNCHNPHSPHFKKIKPLPPPVRQEDIQIHHK